MAQSVKRLTSAQVMISWFVSSSPALGSVLTVQSLEPPLDSVSPSLSAPPLLVRCLSKINKHLKKFKKGKSWTNDKKAKSWTLLEIFLFSFLNVYVFFRKRDTHIHTHTHTQSTGWGGAEREGDTESKGGSRL